MLTKEEYIKSYNYLFDVLSRGYDHFGIVEEVKYNPITRTTTIKPLRKRERALRVLNDLIFEHFNPQPYKFEDLQEGMWVWDNRISACVKIRNTFVKEVINQKTKQARKEPRIKFKWGESVFEENRFFPIQMANVWCKE